MGITKNTVRISLIIAFAVITSWLVLENKKNKTSDKDRHVEIAYSSKPSVADLEKKLLNLKAQEIKLNIKLLKLSQRRERMTQN
jgi:hypothetical protein